MIAAAAPMLLEAAARALLAALVLWIGLRLLRVRNVPAQKTAWGLVLALALAMPLLMRMPLPRWAQIPLPVLAWPHGASASSPAPAAHLASASAPSFALLPASSTAASPLDAAPESAPTAPAPNAAPLISMSEFDPPLRVAAEKARAAAPISGSPQTLRFAARASLSALPILWSFYLVVGVALLLRLLLGLITSLRLWLRARPVEMPSVLGHPRAIPVRASHCVASPVNVGSGIVLPADFASWDAQKLRVVLAHECSHVRQRDFYLQLLAGLYAALLWFSPLGWWLKRRLSELGEAISDRAALSAARSPSAYAELLLEFAALPRSPLIGVPMAHARNLSARIERLLNEAAFRQSFGRSRRAFAALLLVPIALLASTALVRVHAAQAPRSVSAEPVQQQAQQVEQQTQQVAQEAPQVEQQTQQAEQEAQQAAQEAPQVQQQAQQAGQEAQQAAREAQQQGQPDVPAAPAVPAVPAAPPAPSAAPAPPAPPDSAAPGQNAIGPAGPVPPIPPLEIPPISIPRITVPEIAIPPIDIGAISIPDLNGQLLLLDREGFGACAEACALVGDPGTTPRLFGFAQDGDAQEIDKARKRAHGHFFWFRKDGKSYIVDDPAIVGQLESMQSRLDDLREQMRGLRQQYRGVSQQWRDQARKQREAAQNLPKPDLSDAVAQLNAAVAGLKSSQGGTVSREQLAEIQRRLSEIQSKLIASEVKVDWNAGDWSKWSDAMSKYGAQMGALGSQMGQAAKENSEKIRSLIDESLKDGKARPVD